MFIANGEAVEEEFIFENKGLLAIDIFEEVYKLFGLESFFEADE